MDENIELFKSLLASVKEREAMYEVNIFNDETSKIKGIIKELETNRIFLLLSEEEINQFSINLYKSITNNFLEKCNRLSSERKEEVEEKYHNEYFYQTITRLYTKEKYNPNVAYLEGLKSEKMDDFIEFFKDNNQSAISFLDEVPIEDREEIIINILKWGQKYYRGKIFTRQVTDKRTINHDIKKLNEVQKFIESFLPKVTSHKSNTKEINGKNIIITYTDYEGIPYTDIFFLEEIVKKIILLQDDLETRNFKIFPREYYFDTKVTVKEELKKIFEDIAKRYKLKGLKQIEAFLPLLPSP